MGRSSSSKKVARAARSGGRPGQSRNWAWPAVVTSLVVLGVALIVMSRPERSEALSPKIGEHWHAAIGVYVCGQFQPPVADVRQEVGGIHSHGDGLIHMHPNSTKYTGRGANLEAFAANVDLEITDTALRMPGGVSYSNGEDCEDGEGQVRLVVWDSAAAEEGREITTDIAQYNPQDGEVLTLAFAPPDVDLPKPPSAGQAPTDVPGAPPVTIPGVEEGGEAPGGPAEGDPGAESGDTTEDESTSTSAAETTTSSP